MSEQETFIPPYPLHTPVLFLVFNRPDKTRQVFEAIRQAKPPRLYIAADGPRENFSGEGEKCRQVRQIATAVDWDCDIKTLFREKNMGCKYAMSGGIDWFFENEEMGIILEDDCLPSQSFFWFCEEMLKKYKEDTRIMKVGGYNLIDNYYANHDYVFTHFCFTWGWASWRRAWKHFDVKMNKWPLVRDGYISKTYPFVKSNVDIFEDTYNGKIDTWDYQWEFAIVSNYAFSIVPVKSLIRNIGFGSDATHTHGDGGDRAKINNNELTFPIRHPDFVFRNSVYEDMFWKKIKSENTLFRRFISKVKQMLSRYGMA